MIKSFEIYFLIFLIYAFMGWVLESIGGIFNPKVKKFVNRGFLIGPYCPVYGVGVVLISLILKKYEKDVIALFFFSILICGTLEYSTGYIMEKLFNARWWDYSKRKFNINGRVCLETLLPFGIAATFIICKINPFLIGNIEKMSDLWLHIITIILGISFIIDFIISFNIILTFKGEIRSRKDNTEEIVELVKGKTDELGEKVKDKIEEVGDIIYDKAEDAWMKTESDLRYYERKYKLKFLRKTRYTRKRLSEKVPESINEISKRILIRKENFENKIKNKKEQIDKQIKIRITEYEMKAKENNMVTKQVVEQFKKYSILKARLMNAFPNLKITEDNRLTNEKHKEKSKKK